MRPATAHALGVAFVAVQLVVPLTRLRPGAPYPLSGRFAWTMFAGPLVGRCAHDLRATLADGTPAPMPPRGSALHTVLSARGQGEFSQAVWLFAPYSDSDREVSLALDALLRRWASTLPAGTRVESALRCASPGWAPFARTLRVAR